MKIALTYNLKRTKPTIENDEEAEFDSWETILGIKKSLEQRGHKVLLVEADEDAYLKFKKLKPEIDLVFNVAEGRKGEAREAQIPAMLEMLGIPYTGSGPLTLAVTLNKALTKEILLYHGISTPKFQLFKNGRELLDKKLKFPLIVKPNEEGSSKGIEFGKSIVKNNKDLRQRIQYIIQKYRQPALVEEFLSGREFTVAILGNEKEEKVLPIIELNMNFIPKGVTARKIDPIDSFESKHLWDKKFWQQSENAPGIASCPASLTKKLKKSIEDICVKTFRVLGCRDLARIDLRLDKYEIPHILEINPLPAIGDRADGFPEAALKAGLSYEELINKIVDLAWARYKFS